jgi:hypothetical protein
VRSVLVFYKISGCFLLIFFLVLGERESHGAAVTNGASVARLLVVGYSGNDDHQGTLKYSNKNRATSTWSTKYYTRTGLVSNLIHDRRKLVTK